MHFRSKRPPSGNVASSGAPSNLAVELVRALVWPVFLTVVLISFWTPLHRIAALLPSLIERSDSITISGLSIKVAKRLKAKASSDVEYAVGKLSIEGIRKVLELSEQQSTVGGSVAPLRQYNAELIKLGLVVEQKKPSVEIEGHTRHEDAVYLVMTDLGKRSKEFLVTVVAEFVQELSDQSVSK